MQFTAEMIAGFLGGEIVGDKEAIVTDFAKIEDGRPGALSFLSNPKYEPYIYSTLSTIVIVGNDFEPRNEIKATLIKVPNAYGAFAKLLELYIANKPQKTGISAKAEISEKATIGKNCYVGSFTVIEDGAVIGDNVKIYPNSYVGERVRIGDNTVLHAGVKIYEECLIGTRCLIHAGAVIGADGFGFAPDENGNFNKIPQIGNVVVEDDVEIGANTCIDRATMGSTMIHRGVKLDNLVQIGHNVVVGENTVAAALVGIAGTSKVGKNCMFGGQAGISGHLTLGDNVQLGSKTGITRNIPSGETYLGYPGLPVSKFHRSHAIFRQLPELSKTVYKLEKQVKDLMAEKQ